MNCTYTKTISGRCDQQVAYRALAITDDDVCYYHDKVRAGLIDADEQQSLNDMPKIAEIG